MGYDTAFCSAAAARTGKAESLAMAERWEEGGVPSAREAKMAARCLAVAAERAPASKGAARRVARPRKREEKLLAREKCCGSRTVSPNTKLVGDGAVAGSRARWRARVQSWWKGDDLEVVAREVVPALDAAGGTPTSC